MSQQIVNSKYLLLQHNFTLEVDSVPRKEPIAALSEDVESKNVSKATNITKPAPTEEPIIFLDLPDSQL